MTEGAPPVVHPLIALITKKIDAFDEAYAALTNDLEPISHGAKSAPLKPMLTMYALLDDIKDKAEALTKMCNILMPDIAETASKIMINNGDDALEFNGMRFTPDIKTYINVKKDDKPACLEWLKADEIGKELISTDYNANAFSSFIKNMLDEKGWSPAPLHCKFTDEQLATQKILPKFVSTFDKNTIKIKKLKPK